MSHPLLQVENLRIEVPTRHEVLTAVDDVSFTIAPGEVLGVVGESGAGKSLTGAAIIGLLEPPLRIAAGRILLDGRRIDDLPYEAMRRIRGKEIGAIFQDPLTSLNPLYTIGQQLIETIRTHLDLGPAAARERALSLLSEVGISGAEQRLDHYPHQFSGGMRQRVVIALALAANPRLIIADEPHHPYTIGLMDSIPRIGERRGRLRQIEGAMPRLSEIPPGCPFNPRCPEVFDRCYRERPDLLPAPGTEAACWLYDPARAQQSASPPHPSPPFGGGAAAGGVAAGGGRALTRPPPPPGAGGAPAAQRRPPTGREAP